MLTPIVFENKIVVIISNAIELSQLASVHENYYNRDGVVIFTNNIDMSGIEYSPPGTLDKPFRWHVEGGMNKISNLNLNVYNRHFGGLFGYANCTIKNLQLENIQTEARSYTGALVGFADNCNIENIILSKVNLSGRLFVGGLIGGALQTNVKYVKLDLFESTLYSTSERQAMIISQVGPGSIISDVELKISNLHKLVLFSNVVKSVTPPIFQNIMVHQQEVGKN